MSLYGIMMMVITLVIIAVVGCGIYALVRLFQKRNAEGIGFYAWLSDPVNAGKNLWNYLF